MPKNLASESWSAMCDRIAAAGSPVAWRFVAAPSGQEGWGLVALVVGVGESANSRLDRYPAAIVSVEELSAEAAASRLRDGKVSAGAEGFPDISLPRQENVVPQWLYSADTWALTESGWPRLVLSTGAGQTASVDGREPLQSPGMPFYPSLEAAVAERVFSVAPAQLRLGQHPPLLVRITDRRGRIAAVEAKADEVHLDVQGGEDGALEGFSVRAAWRRDPASSDWERYDGGLTGPGRIPLATGGIPAEFVAVLVDPDGREIDRRSWDEQFGRPIEEPESLGGLVARWLSEGEHEYLEYKQALVEEKTRVSFAETVAAFANRAGGAVLVGVDDEGRVIGYGPPKVKDQVANIIAELVQERPTFEVREVQIEGKPIVVVRVAPSPVPRRPHQVRGRIMVRVLGTTRGATPAEVRELAAMPEEDLEWQLPGIRV